MVNMREMWKLPFHHPFDENKLKTVFLTISQEQHAGFKHRPSNDRFLFCCFHGGLFTFFDCRRALFNGNCLDKDNLLE